MRSHKAGCAYVAGANFDPSNITKKGKTMPKRKLINRLVRLSGGRRGCKLRSPTSRAVLAEQRKWRREAGATVWKQTPLTAGRAKRNAEEWSCRGS